MRMRIGIWLGCLLSFILASTAYAGVTPDMQHAIRENTFEVVMKKPENDPVAYEKPLPLELLPFIERTDAYRSVGTAFALGNNTYVTAGHVFLAGIDSQFGPPALRASDGTVFEVDRILKFSVDEDFVEFSLRKDPGPAGLHTNRDPKLDEPVLAVGNALGEGIVIRDGLFTSETPEAQDGRWKWLRFSAAASPGNSGGPLCDGQGNVIGIVIGKSPNENLNYSLPISRVLDAAPMKARFDVKMLVTIPYMHGTVTYAYKDEFGLPLAWPEFVQAFQKVALRHSEQATAQLLKTYADTLFPKGPGSQDLLFAPHAEDGKPRLITQQADGTWTADRLEYHQIELPEDGSVSYADVAGVRLVSLARSAAASDDAFYGDSKTFMDIALKALDLRRPVGTDKVRVTSLGAAKSDTLYTDPYGRRWQERVWAIPFMDAYLMGELLPTPEGYAAILAVAPSVGLPQSRNLARLYAAQLDVSYSGNLSQWRAALSRRALLPVPLSGLKLENSPVWTLRTPRFVLGVPPTVLSLSDKSPLTLTMGFMPDGAQGVSWDIEGVSWNQDDRKDASVELWRFARPPGNVKLDLRNRFAAIWDRRSPYDGMLSRDTVDTYSVGGVLDVPGNKASSISSDLVYGLTVRLVEHPSSASAAAALARMHEATQVLEHGVGADTAKDTSPDRRPDAIIEELEKEVTGGSADIDRQLGRDIRGRLMSEDLHDYMTALKTEMPSTNAAWVEDQKAKLAYFQAYWNLVPALMHNRDMFASFLERNHLPASRPHTATVLEAERSLLASLNTGHPSEDWPKREEQLREAYVQERNALVHSTAVAAVLRPRTSPCPAPVTTTTGTAHPAAGLNTQNLEDLWPSESRRLGEEGTVIASLRISPTGCITKMGIAGSSGSDMLDQAVLRYLETQSLTPAGPDGKAVESQASIPVVFKLRN